MQIRCFMNGAVPWWHLTAYRGMLKIGETRNEFSMNNDDDEWWIYGNLGQRRASLSTPFVWTHTIHITWLVARPPPLRLIIGLNVNWHIIECRFYI